MSILRSYYNRNNTIQNDSFINTGRNPVTQLFFGEGLNFSTLNGFTRFIFDLDLDLLREKLATSEISTGCTTAMTHTLVMTNTSSFDQELLNDTASDGSRRASSFDLILYRLPLYSGSTTSGQTWDEGVGFDYVEDSVIAEFSNNKPYSTRPSNWFQRTTITNWSEPGTYSNTNSNPEGSLNYTGLTIVDRQHFEFGNEDIEFDMTNEINDLLYGNITGVT